MRFTIAACSSALFFATVASAQVTVVIDRNTGAAATHAFKFARVPSPKPDDAATNAKATIVDGTRDEAGYSLAALTDGLLPRDEDEPGANFFFDAGTGGGRVALDLGRVLSVGAVNTFSWHPNTRGPQIYTLYASDGADPKFCAAPKNGVDPASCGWKKITAVNTAPRGPTEDLGGQYGVSITDKSGPLGAFRYLLFECSVTETFDDFGNTFYSEIDVVESTAKAQGKGTRHKQRGTDF